MKNPSFKANSLRSFISISLVLTLIFTFFTPSVTFASNASLSEPLVNVNSSTSIDVHSVLTGGTENVSYYWFEYSTSPYFTSVTQTSRSIPTYNSMSISANIAGLNLDYKYYVRAVAQVSSGHIRYSLAVEVGDGNYSGSSQGSVSLSAQPSVTFYSDTSATLFTNFTNTGGTDLAGGFIYSTDDPYLTYDNRQGRVSATTSSNGLSATFSNLTVGQTYYVKAYVDYYDGNSLKQVVSTNSTAYTHNVQGLPTVETNNISIKNLQLTATGTLTNTGSSDTYERGFIWSHNNSSPTIANDSITSSSSTVFTSSFDFSSGHSHIYVRSYAKNNSGYSYGDTISISLGNSLPTLITYSPTNITVSSADVPMSITYNGTSDLIGMGVIYSTSSSPTLESNGGRIILPTSDYQGTAEITNLDRNTTYYVRSYATNSNGTGYGEIKSFTTNDEDRVLTSVVTNITANSASSGGYISSNIDYTVRERGLVYSKDNEIPEITNSATVADTTAGVGNFDLDMVDLLLDTKYYVRAFIRTSQGYEYGNVRSFVTSDSSHIVVDDIFDIKRNEATINASISSSVTDEVYERGIVYSSINETPTVNGSSSSNVLDQNNGYGNYSIVLNDLNKATTYYLRAYAKIGNTYAYSKVVTFATTEAYNVNISYVTSIGTLIGTETVQVAPNDDLTLEKLSIPSGYELQGNSFTRRTITQDESIDIMVTGVNDPSKEAQFIEARSNYTFEPDTPITRIEVARMIYALKGEGKIYEQTTTFSDIPSTHPDLNAINFAYNYRYMQGYPEGNFLPDNNITRAEMTVILYTIYKLEPKEVTVSLSDIDYHWAKQYITIAAQNGIINGYEDGTFNPGKSMTRAEATVIFSRAENRSLLPLGNVMFTDVPQTHYAFKHIMNASIPKQ